MGNAAARAGAQGGVAERSVSPPSEGKIEDPPNDPEPEDHPPPTVAPSIAAGRSTKARSPQTNGICERFHKTILADFYQVALRKELYRSP